MFKNCTFNINILTDDKHQQETNNFDGSDDQQQCKTSTYVKFDGFWHDRQDDINSLLKELHLIEGADYYWEDYRLINRSHLWVLPTCFGMVYDAIHSSAGICVGQVYDFKREPSDTMPISIIYELLREHKAIRLELVNDKDVNIYKVTKNDNAN
jgi:hypothetical protein